MFEIVGVIVVIAVLAIVFGLLSILLARYIIIAELWTITLPLRVFKRGWSLKPPSRRLILLERVFGAFWLLLGIYVLTQFPIQWAKLPKVAPSKGGDMAALMAKYAEPLVTKGQVVGIAVGIIKGNKSATAGVGRVRLSGSRKPDADTIFELGSVTKVFTSTALSAMVERGEVKLDDPVASLLPQSFKIPSCKERQITLVDLATHTSGLPRVADYPTGWRDFIDFSFIKNPYACHNEADLKRFLADCKLASSPGEKCEYSNLGMGLLGYALCVKQGRSYEKMIKAEVCQPLGLKDTTISLSKNQSKRLAQGYYGNDVDENNIICFPASNWRFTDSNAGAGAMRSTVNDLLKLVRANLGDAPAGLKSTLEATHKVRYKIDEKMSVCLGWHTLSTPKHKEPIIWHNGGTGGYSSFVGFCKKHHTGVVLLCNVSPLEVNTDSVAVKTLHAACRKRSNPSKP